MKVIESCSCNAEIEIDDAVMREVVALLQQWRDHHPCNIRSPRGGRSYAEAVNRVYQGTTWGSGRYSQATHSGPEFESDVECTEPDVTP